jgi:hypothetical protein
MIPFLDLITSEHNTKPKFVLTLQSVTDPLTSIISLTTSMPVRFDLDFAVGQQLDILGEWIGQSRDVSIPLQVYFSLDTPLLGFDLGTWKGRFDSLTGLVSLPDDSYRTLLRAVIIANYWDGTKEVAYEAWSTLFGADYRILIIDNPFTNDYFSFDASTLGFDSGGRWYDARRAEGNMTMSIALLSRKELDAVTRLMFENGLLDLKPEAVKLVAHITQTVVNFPLFGFDYEISDNILGFDVGAWAKIQLSP